MTTNVFLVKAHSWDYDFHDTVEAVFSTAEAAIAYVDSAGQKEYDALIKEGLVVESWALDSSDNPKIVYYQGGIVPSH